MNEALWIFLGGIVIVAASFLLKNREKELFENAVPAQATVVRYDEYRKTDGLSEGEAAHPMYTAVMSYRLADGTVIEGKEQSGRSYRKYEIGMVLDIEYSPQQPDFFIIRGDKSRTVAFAAMLVFGLVMIVLAVMMYLQQSGGLA